MSGVIIDRRNVGEDLDSFDSDCRAGVLGRPSLGNTAIGADNSR